MRRDWNLLRSILLRIESEPVPFNGDYNPYINVKDAPMEVVAEWERHLDLLRRAGFVRSKDHHGYPVAPTLTFQGYEVLDMIRDDTVWYHMKFETDRLRVGMTLDVIRMFYLDALRARGFRVEYSYGRRESDVGLGKTP